MSMNTNNTPSKGGQISKLVHPNVNEKDYEVYIISDENISEKLDEDYIVVVALTDLQRNINTPQSAPRKQFKKSELVVVAEDLESYVASWNKPYNKQYLLRSAEDVKQFFRDIHSIYDAEFHPDDDFKDYTDGEENRSFTDEQAEYLNKIMVDCFQFCEDNDLDIYELAGEVQVEIWTKQGIWPPNN